MQPLNRRTVFILLLAGAMLCSCGGHAHRQGWGQGVTLFPGWRKAGSAARHAALSPETWAPLAAALFVQIEDMDGRITDWASDNTPVFGSNKNADDWSDYLRDAAGAAYVATAVATESGADVKQCLISKAKGVAVGAGAIGLTVGATKLIKNSADRTRPNGQGDESFVSGHTSSAAGFTTLSKKNLDDIHLSTGAKRIVGAGLTGLAAFTGWARVEAKEHYLSDVLAGYAVGHFICAVINDTFLAADDRPQLQVDITPSKGGILLGIRWIY